MQYKLRDFLYFVCAFLLSGFLVLAKAETATVPGEGEFLTLCYHNIEDSDPDQRFEGVSTDRFVQQLTWLQHAGYTPVSIDDILSARAGKKPLPSKAVLLTFDDGYESFYTRVYPILKAFHYPAVLAVVDQWMTENPNGKMLPGENVHYGESTMPRSAFLTWEQVREMQRSGLVEVASHTSALHYGVIANSNNNTEPAATSLKYDSATKTYETSEQYKQRIEADAAASVSDIVRRTGQRPRVIVWPYGAYNNMGIMIENKNGMSFTLSLDDGFSKVDSLNVPRFLVKNDPDLKGYAVEVLQSGKKNPLRVVQVDLDYIYDADAKQQSHNIDMLVSRIHDMKITTVFLQAFADPKGTGLASQLYFPNRVLPMRADLFNHVAWQLATRAKVKVFGWLPVLSFDLGNSVTPVMAWDPKTNTTKPDAKAYHRVSPFDPAARQRIIEIYEDMAMHGPIEGILFHDDAMLSDFEDASPAALKAYQAAGFSSSIADIRSHPDQMQKWTNFKTEALINFTQELTEHVKHYSGHLTTVRNIYAPVMLQKNSEEWLAQSYTRFLQAYDYVAVEAMPRMENISSWKAEDWMLDLVKVAANTPNGLTHTIFELQSVDWREQHNGNTRAVPIKELSAQMRLLSRNGAMNFGYYPDDFVTDTPSAEKLHRDFSTQTYPYTP